MINLKTICRSMLKAICVFAFAVPMAISCSETILKETFVENDYDDSKLKEEIEQIKTRLYELEQSMNAEIDALKALFNGKLHITKVSKASDGSVVVELSNGQTLTLLPEKDMKSFVTYVTMDGVDYWAYIDSDGKKQRFLDKDGNPIPVVSEVPEVITRGDELFLVIGGKEYPLAGNSIFSGYELITDDLTGEIYAVTFTFGEGMSFTVTLDGAAGFDFVISMVWSSVIIDNYYVPMGTTQNVQIDARGVVDYVLQIPDGWRVKEIEDEFMGTKYFAITAPSAELVESGVAAADGELKVVAVLEGGKATVSKLYLSTKAFKSLSVSLAGATVEMYNGLFKYAYGICKASEYDETAILATATGLLDAYDYPKGYGVSDYNMMDLPLEEIAGEALTPGEQYVFWVLPAMYDENAEDSMYYFEEGTFENVKINYSSVVFDITNESFTDANLSMDLKGVDGYFMGVEPSENFYVEDVLIKLNYDYYEKKTTPMSYNGSVFSFAGVEAESATGYVAWIVVAEEGKVYTAADVLLREFSTLSLVAGSSATVTADVKEEAIDITAELSSEGAENIYYSFLSVKDAAKYADDEARSTYLFEKGKVGEAEGVTAKLSEFISKVKAGTDYVLFAVATDSEGKYGTVLVKECKTTAIEYNDMIVSIEIETNTPDLVVLNISSTGENDGYLYWLGKTSENTWKSGAYLGGSAETAQQYMFMNRTSRFFTEAAAKYPIENGKINLTDHTPGDEYAIVVMAKDKDGGYSQATALKFTPHIFNIGKVVPSTDEGYSAAEPTVEWLTDYFRPASGLMPGFYAFNLKVPSGFTAYVICASKYYFSDNAGNPVDYTVEEKILSIMDTADSGRDYSNSVNPELDYPYSDIFYHGTHGAPSHGYGVIWASKEYHDSVCDCGGNYETTGQRNGIEVPVYHVIHINDGNPVRFSYGYATGSKTEVVDQVMVVCQDLQGNCYEPFVIDVPMEYFVDANAGE